MGSFDYIETIWADLLADRITWEQVLTKIHGSKPWQKADWKKRREQLIGESCGVCESRNPPLVLQHIWHPAPFNECCDGAREKILKQIKYLKRHPYPEEPTPLTLETAPVQPSEARASCPKCGGINVKNRLRSNWICNSQHQKRYCGHTFDEPVIIEYRKYDEEGWVSHLNSKQRWETHQQRLAWTEKFNKKYRDAVLKEAALIALAQHERYVSLRPEDVVTRCKKCAFKEDLAFREDYRRGVIVERLRSNATPEADVAS